jgi:hypothetical protein
MGKQLLNIIGISTSSLQTNTFALILGVSGTKKRIPIIIGAYEAQAIAIELEGMNPSRPLTHDLMRNIINAFNIKVVEVHINKFSEGVFYALISLFDGVQTIEIDSRTSDAIALAVRYDCTIYADDAVIEAAAMEEETGEEEIDEELEDWDSDELEEYAMTVAELEIYLDELILNENYEEASKVRDEINKRKSKADDDDN